MRKTETRQTETRKPDLLIAATAAFCVYFCMYAFRKPFSAGTFEGKELFELNLKTLLVLSQLAGYTISKFIGIKIVSEMNRKYRAAAIIGLIAFAELALVGFAFAPLNLKVVCMFLNGLPLGMIFGFVLSYLEGRKQTEALAAALCASFIISSGVVKSIGQWLINSQGVSEFQMPMIVGLIFFLPLLASVWLLQKTPPPSESDIELRNARQEMSRQDRTRFFMHYWPGLTLVLLVYILLSIIRTIRDDFGVEIWQDMGVKEKPAVFATSETYVGVVVTLINAIAIFFRSNFAAIRFTFAMMCASFLMITFATAMQINGRISPFLFMVFCGIGLYIPYVAFHTTLFERIIAISKRPANLGFLMYLADSIGYLFYAAVLTFQKLNTKDLTVLPLFRFSLFAGSAISIIALISAMIYFQKKFSSEDLPSK